MEVGARASEDRRPLTDSFGRTIGKVRISTIERCNFRCMYCMPSEPVWFDRRNILTFEEMGRVVRVLAGMGVSKVKLTGGEPLVRRDVEKLVSLIAGTEGVSSLSMTTNGFFLEDKAKALKEAGLQAVTVSLPSLDRERFKAITGVDALYKVLRGIDAALDAGFSPVKLNATVVKGINEEDLVPLAMFAKEKGIFMRYIEFMPFDGNGSWNVNKVVPWRDMLDRIRREVDLVPLGREASATSLNYGFKGSAGGVGFIASITSPFCDDCERVRLTADGKIVPCMFSLKEFDLRPLLRGGGSDEELEEFIRRAVLEKDRGVKYMIQSGNLPTRIRPMYTLGG